MGGNINLLVQMIAESFVVQLLKNYDGRWKIQFLVTVETYSCQNSNLTQVVNFTEFFFTKKKGFVWLFLFSLCQ